MMNWNHSEVIALSKEGCTNCGGHGIRPGAQHPCNCVFRRIFRACYSRFKSCVKGRSSAVQFEHVSHAVNNPRVYGRKNEEYIADFLLISRRTLGDQEYTLFRSRFLLGADEKLCSRQLGLNVGKVNHAVYRVQEKLGRAFRETEPYGIFPLDEYFGGAVRVEKTTACKVVEITKTMPVRPPLFPVAA
jgi:hypothetical protein